ncbi:MAG: hypothetical protein IKI75_03045 [Lachnospiraceae bacterium]|nr:hypothetical protein [Lachnospiraceae bacterium]
MVLSATFGSMPPLEVAAAGYEAEAEEETVAAETAGAKEEKDAETDPEDSSAPDEDLDEEDVEASDEDEYQPISVVKKSRCY